jgi:hypothetical protein
MEEKLILKRASASRPSGEWNNDDYDVLSDGKVIGRIMKAAASPRGIMDRIPRKEESDRFGCIGRAMICSSSLAGA